MRINSAIALLILLCSVTLGASTSLRRSARSFESGEALTPGDEGSYILEDKTADTREFYNPALALGILNKLNPLPTPNITSNKSLMIKRDPNYCLKTHEYLVKNPTSVFNELNFLTDYSMLSYFRKDIVPMVGRDVMPYINSDYIRLSQKLGGFDIEPSVNNIFFKLGVHNELHIGSHFACLTQNYNHIPGSDDIANKDAVAHNLKIYYEKYKNQPTCSPGDKFFPQTWLLANEAECKEWFAYINSPEYEREKAEKTIVFIRKIGVGVHRGAGVQPVDEEEEQMLRRGLKNGENCGKKMDYSIIVQRYISNPLLVYNHKFDFRVYMMVSSTNPLTVYYHDGFLRVSLYEYDVNSKAKGAHLTNTAQSEDVFKDKELQEKMGMNETELRNFQMWNYTRLANYLISEGRIDSLGWIDGYLRPKIEHAMQHLIRITKNSFAKQSNLWELYGVDFMLDDKLNLWFIECNRSPVIKDSNEEKGLFLRKLFRDGFEILSAQLRSRMKRVIKFVNMLTSEGFARENTLDPSDVVLPNLEENRRIFNSLLENKIDDEFKISPDNSWIKIVDETLPGVERYNGMFPIECFD